MSDILFLYEHPVGDALHGKTARVAFLGEKFSVRPLKFYGMFAEVVVGKYEYALSRLLPCKDEATSVGVNFPVLAVTEELEERAAA